MHDLFLLHLSLMFLKRTMLLKNLIMCAMIILLSRFTFFNTHNFILESVFMLMLSNFYKIIVHAINLVLLLNMPIMLSFWMNFGLYVYSIIITKLFIDHQIMVTTEILSAKSEKFDGNNFRCWQNQ